MLLAGGLDFVHFPIVFSVCERPSQGLEKESHRSNTAHQFWRDSPLHKFLIFFHKQKMKTYGASGKYSTSTRKKPSDSKKSQKTFEDLSVEELDERLRKLMGSAEDKKEQR